MGGQDDAAPDATATTPTPTSAAATTPSASPEATTAPITDPATPTGPGTAAANTGFETGAGLPAGVVRAHESGDVIALLVVNRKATEDRRLEAAVQTLRGRSDTSVFVVAAKDVTEYSRIAEGVDLDRVPALVVVEPKGQVEGALPVASISYGFRGPESVEQAVSDVLYDGRDLGYDPG